MGLFGTAIAFGAGYAAGMKLGDRPVRTLRAARDEARAQGVSAAMRGLASEGGGSRSVRSVMSGTPETVPPDASLAEAASAMERADIGDVLVVDGPGQLRGIVTDRDIAIRAIAEGRDPSSTTVGEIMTAEPATIAPTDTLDRAFDLMRTHDVRRLPVVEGGRPVGVVSLGDVSGSSRARSALADISAAPPNN